MARGEDQGRGQCGLGRDMANRHSVIFLCDVPKEETGGGSWATSGVHCGQGDAERHKKRKHWHGVVGWDFVGSLVDVKVLCDATGAGTRSPRRMGHGEKCNNHGSG